MLIPLTNSYQCQKQIQLWGFLSRPTPYREIVPAGCSQSSLCISAILYADSTGCTVLYSCLKIQMPIMMTHCIALIQEAEGHRWQSLHNRVSHLHSKVTQVL